MVFLNKAVIENSAGNVYVTNCCEFFLSRYWYADHAIPCGEPNSAIKGMARPS